MAWLTAVGKCEGFVLYHTFFNLQISVYFWITTVRLYFYFFLKQECDQVHIEDVASDDNGQDLRWYTDECMKRIADVICFLWGLQTQMGLRDGGQHCAGDETWQTVFVCWVVFP